MKIMGMFYFELVVFDLLGSVLPQTIILDKKEKVNSEFPPLDA